MMISQFFFAGFFSIRVSDPNYPEQLLFDYDIGVRCPKTFTIDFALPTRGEDNYDKRMKMEIEDTYRKINLIVFRPAPNMTKETIGRLLCLLCARHDAILRKPFPH